MDYGRRPGGLRNILYYLPKTVKFYDLKSEPLTRVVFIVILAISFIGQIVMFSLYPEDMMLDYAATEINLEALLHDTLVITAVNLVTNILAYLISVVYLLAFLKELKHEDYTLAGCLKFVLRNSFKIIAAFIGYALMIALASLLLIIPGLIVYIMLLFNTCYIVDKKCGILEAYKASRYVTKGSRLQIFGIIALINLLLVLVLSFIGSANNMLVYAFVSSFITTIFNLMYQRLTALMYMDLEYDHVDKAL